MAGLGTFYKAGLDYVGRQIVVFVGRHLPVTKIDMDKVEWLKETRWAQPFCCWRSKMCIGACYLDSTVSFSALLEPLSKGKKEDHTDASMLVLHNEYG